MTTTEQEMIYKVDEIPPIKDLLMLSVQQMLIMFTAATFPAMLVREAGGTLEESSCMVALTMIAAGLGSVIQARKGRFIGSGYLCPNLCGPSYFAVSMQAAWSGGFALMRGMIVFSGVIEMVLAGLIKRLSFLFPPPVVGLVVMMVGVSVIPVSITNFFGIKFAGDSFGWQEVCVGIISLSIMIGANIWGKKAIKMYCLLLGVSVGWLTALFLLPDTLINFRQVIYAPWVDFPIHSTQQLKLSFSVNQIVPFLIISVCGSLKTLGNLVAAQKISEPELEELNMKPISKGLMADGLTTAMAGLIGAMAVDTSSSNVGLAAATRAVSRWIAICAGVIFAALGFSPKLSMAIATVPPPVVGACLIFAISFMICTGLAEMTSQKLTEREIFAIGVATIIGLGTGFVPGVFNRLPHMIQPFFSDPLSSTTILAIILYQVFHFDRFLIKFKTNPAKKTSRADKNTQKT
ncbi:MAG: xanthine permease [Desulfobacteraceae bacterium]|nr:xanthine permease [Desulfobacteraceae bacterium]